MAQQKAKLVRARAKKSKSKPKKQSVDDSEDVIMQDPDYAKAPVALSPFYSFSSHWSHISRQYLCLSTWGTCMGGVNEQYDDIMEYEASMPLVEQNYKQSFEKWKKEKKEYERKQAAHADPAMLRQQSAAAMLQSAAKAALAAANQRQQQQSHSQQQYHHSGHGYANNNIPMHPRHPQTVSPSNAIASGNGNVASKSPQKTAAAASNLTRVDEEVDASQSTGTEPENSSGNDTKNSSAAAVANPAVIATQLTSTQSQHPQHPQRGVNPSFGRKMDLFTQAIAIKRQSTVEEQEWKEKRASAMSASPHFKPMENDGSQYIETFAATPVARSVTNTSTRKVSNQTYSAHTKRFQDQSAIVTNDEAANAPASEKIKLFQRLSVGHGPDAN